MAAAKRSTKKALPIDGTPAQVLAAKIVADRVDLTPSVRRIVDAELGEDATLHALSLFETSLTAPGDPMRDPSKAIDAARTEFPEPATAD